MKWLTRHEAEEGDEGECQVSAGGHQGPHLLAPGGPRHPLDGREQEVHVCKGIQIIYSISYIMSYIFCDIYYLIFITYRIYYISVKMYTPLMLWVVLRLYISIVILQPMECPMMVTSVLVGTSLSRRLHLCCIWASRSCVWAEEKWYRCDKVIVLFCCCGFSKHQYGTILNPP